MLPFFQSSLLLSKQHASSVFHVPSLKNIHCEFSRVPAFWGFLIPFALQYFLLYGSPAYPLIDIWRKSQRSLRVKRFCRWQWRTAHVFLFFHAFQALVLAPNIKMPLFHTIHATYLQQYVFRSQPVLTPFAALRHVHRSRAAFIFVLRFFFRILPPSCDNVWVRRDVLRVLGLPLQPFQRTLLSTL